MPMRYDSEMSLTMNVKVKLNELCWICDLNQKYKRMILQLDTALDEAQF